MNDKKKGLPTETLFGDLAEKKADEFLVEIALVGLVAHGEIRSCLFVYNRLAVGEGIKTGFSVIGTHTPFSHTAEAHFAGGKVDDHILDALVAEDIVWCNAGLSAVEKLT